METKTRRQALVLGGLLVALAAILWWNLGAAPPPAAPVTAPAGAQARVTRGAQPQLEAQALEVDLDALTRARPAPEDGSRNPFRFESKAAPAHALAPPPAPPGGVVGPDGRIIAGSGPAGPPPVPAIPLKFIGVVEPSTDHRRLAALSDGRFTYYGREGDIIDGRYRIVRIGVESIEMAHVDGRGAQTIRLSGS